MPICLNCNLEKDKLRTRGNTPGFCVQCASRVAEKKYKKTEKGKITAKKFNLKQSEEKYHTWHWRNNPEYRKKTMERRKSYACNSHERQKERLKKHNEANRDKYLARQALRRAVFRKKIIKPNNCMKCGFESKRIEGHHQDYSKPLEVVWLCVSCHKNIHGKMEVCLGDRNF